MYCTVGWPRRKEWHQSEIECVPNMAHFQSSLPQKGGKKLPYLSAPLPSTACLPSFPCLSVLSPFLLLFQFNSCPIPTAPPSISPPIPLYFCMSHCSSRTMDGSDLAASLNSSRVISSLWSLSILEKILSTRCCGVSPSSFIRIMITVPTIL